jgi:GTPase SAR1 family protein
MPEPKKITGVVMPVGNGAVGKTSLAMALQKNPISSEWQEAMARIRKTRNMEFEFVSDCIHVEKDEYHVLQQYLIPPGQKKSEGDTTGRGYEDVISIYRFQIRKVDVVLLSYMITRLESFQDLEYWVHQVNELCNDHTSFILVGTHLDREAEREVMPTHTVTGTAYVEEKLRSLRPTWRGYCAALEISNLTGANLQELRHAISSAILHARQVMVSSSSFTSC